MLESAATSSAEEDPVSKLPEEVMDMVWGFLGCSDLLSCGLVSHRWRETVNRDVVWRRVCLREGKRGPWPTLEGESGLCTWRRYHRAEARLRANWLAGRCCTWELAGGEAFHTDGRRLALVMEHKVDVYTLSSDLVQLSYTIPFTPINSIRKVLVSGENIILTLGAHMQVFKEGLLMWRKVFVRKGEGFEILDKMPSVDNDCIKSFLTVLADEQCIVCTVGRLVCAFSRFGELLLEEYQSNAIILNTYLANRRIYLVLIKNNAYVIRVYAVETGTWKERTIRPYNQSLTQPVLTINEKFVVVSGSILPLESTVSPKTAYYYVLDLDANCSTNSRILETDNFCVALHNNLLFIKEGDRTIQVIQMQLARGIESCEPIHTIDTELSFTELHVTSIGLLVVVHREALELTALVQLWDSVNETRFSEIKLGNQRRSGYNTQVFINDRYIITFSITESMNIFNFAFNL